MVVLEVQIKKNKSKKIRDKLNVPNFFYCVAKFSNDMSAYNG